MNIQIELLVFILLSSITKLNVHGQVFISVEAPTNVQVTRGSITSTSMWLTWNPVPKADSYMISLKPPTIGASGVGFGILDTNSIISGLTPNTEYLITIRAVQGEVQGNPAVIAQSTALPAPINVFAVEASITENSMTIEWSAVAGTQSYTIEVRPSAGVGGTGGGIYSTQARLRGMSSNTLYTINVYAVNWVGTGAKATLRQYTKLSPPRELIVVVATISPSTIGVQWSEVTGAENYYIQITPSNDFNRNLPRIRDTRYVLRKLEPDTEYRIEVAATNAAGLSEFATVNQRTKSMCFAVADDFQDETFTLMCPPRCETIENRVFGTREYTTDSYICAAAIHDGRINSNVGGRVIVKKRPGILDFVGTYNNGISSKDYENWHRSFVFALQAPESVEVQPGSVAFDRLTLTWSPVSGAEAYRVNVNPPQGVLGIDSNLEDTRVTISGLRPNTTYRIYISAVNRVETSDGTTVVQRTALSAPQNLHILDNSVSYDRFIVAWDAMGVGRDMRYQVVLMAEDRIVLRDETSLTTYVAVNLTSGTAYEVFVRALNEIGLGRTSRIMQHTKLHKPTEVMATMVNSRSMRLEWKPVPGAIYFNVVVMPINITLRVNEYYITIENLQADQLYKVNITAENAYDRSEAATIDQRTSLPPPDVEILPGSLTHDTVTLGWTRLREASYSIIVMYVGGDEPTEVLSVETNEIQYNITGLVERRRYSVSVMGVSGSGRGENGTVAFTTLIMPPMNMRLFFDGLRSSFAYLRWDEISGLRQYHVSCEPSEGLQGLGVVNRTAVRLSDFRFNTSYKAMVMGIEEGDGGMNTSIEFYISLPFPKLVIVHSLTPTSMTIEWDPQSFQISTISYNTSNINRISVRIAEDDEGKVELNNLRSNTFYQINIFSNILSELLGTVGVQQPIASQTIATGFNSNMSDITMFWPRVQSDSSVNYLISTNPIMNLKRNNITDTSLILSGFQSGELYSISVIAENPARMVRSAAATLQFSQESGALVFGKTDAENFENDFGPVDGDNNERNGDEQMGDGDNNVGNEDWGILNETTNDDNDDEMQEVPVEEPLSFTWIVILVVVGCLLAVVLLILIPCLCGCLKNKPILRNHGWCGCCYDYYV